MVRLIANLFRKKENKFNHIISLGYNCEVTYRFLKYFRFEESGLFNWTFSYSILDLINALNNFDLIGSGDFKLPNPLWECNNTKLRFHGKADMSLFINNTATPGIIEQDRKDLVERICYLKEKFLNITKDNSSKLYIYKIRDSELTKENVENLFNALKNLGANKFKLLVVCQQSANFQYIKTDSQILFRTVKYFAPDDNVTDKKYRKNGWNSIYDEFSAYKPKNYKKKKKYKFDR